jgi:hypothetical protein
MIVRFFNGLLRPFGHKLVSRKFDALMYLHDYGSGGYEEYRRLQEFHNRRKLTDVWADENTLRVVADYVVAKMGTPLRGLCHGTRNGFEQRILAEMLNASVLGTDISPTATGFPNTVQWDFHDVKAEWIGHFDFIYSNSLDQAFDPRKALDTWINQVNSKSGLVFIEHTMSHSASEASEMDPFGAHPMVVPYLFFEWGRGKYELLDIVRPRLPKANNGLDVWLFVLAPFGSRLRDSTLEKPDVPASTAPHSRKGGGDVGII